MSEVLVSAVITDEADNQIDDGFVNAVELGYSDNGSVWGFSPIQATSTSTAGLTVLGDQIWVANRAGTGSSIYATSPSVGFAAFVEQHSAVAPALTTLGQDLVIAYIGAASSGVEVVTSPNGSSWSSKSTTGESSHVAPAVAVLDGILWVAYVAKATGHVELISWSNRTTWTGKIDTGQPSELPPAVSVFAGKLWIAYVNRSTGAIEVMSHDGDAPAEPATTGQTSRYGPALTAFNGALWLAYIGAGSGNLELVSSSGGSTWSSKIDTGRSSQCGPALATIAAVPGPSLLVGHHQYVLTSTAGGKPAGLPPLLGVAVQITITDDLKFDTSIGLSFQLNCYSPAGNDTIGMQQYVLSMPPNSTELFLHIQNFYPASNVAAYAGNSPKVLNFPELGVIPAGWTFNVLLEYATEDDVTGNAVSGMFCAVTDSDGATVGTPRPLSALKQKLAKVPGKTSDASWLAPIVAMELDIVAYDDGHTATLTAGHGFVVYSALNPLEANPSWSSYINSPGHHTTENSNCVNGLIPVGTTYGGTVQSFGVPHA